MCNSEMSELVLHGLDAGSMYLNFYERLRVSIEKNTTTVYYKVKKNNESLHLWVNAN